MRTLFIALVLPLSLFGLKAKGAEGRNDWAGRLLGEILEKGDHRQSSQAYCLKSYRLSHLTAKDSDPRYRSLEKLLRTLLPPGAEIHAESGTGTLHLFCSESAHTAAWELISALDKPGTKGEGAEALREELRTLVAGIEEAKQGNRDLAEKLVALHAEVLQKDKPETENRTRLPVLAGTALLVAAAGLFIGLRKRSRSAPGEDSQEEDSNTLSLLRTDTRVPAALKLQEDLLAAINAAAIRMESWQEGQRQQQENLDLELSKHCSLLDARARDFEQAQERLLGEGRALMATAGERFESSAARLEAGVGRMHEQNDRVEALAGELQSTARELDETKDEMLRLRQSLGQREQELDQARERLNGRERELSHQQAKLAALTLILEEEREQTAHEQQEENELPCKNPTQTYEFLPPPK